ncbi:hypothetical protein VC154_26235, partial [Citrobacter freundii]|nr:hypothetical protein [Citrobacter freundii]
SLKTSIKTITNLSDTNCLEIQGASLVLIKACSIQGRKLFHFSPPERADDFKVDTYDLPYVYSKGSGEKNATTCSAFQNLVR